MSKLASFAKHLGWSKPVFAALLIAGLGGLCGCQAALRQADAAVNETAMPRSLSVSPTALIRIRVGTPAAAPTPDCADEPGSSPLRYAIDAVVDMGKHSAAATLKTTYRNETGHALSNLVFNVPAAHKPQVFELTHFNSGLLIDTYLLDGARLDVSLQQPLLPGCTMSVTMSFTVKAPQIPEGWSSRTGYLGFSDRELNLADWLPAVAPYRNSSWIVPRDWPNAGETTITEAASYSADITVHGADPDQLEIAGPGTIKRLDATSWHFALDHARNFAISLSESFVRQTTLTDSGVSIELYSFARAASKTVDAPGSVLQTARDAIMRYEALFGACRFKRLVIVQGDFIDGMEFSGIMFIGSSWFASYAGTPDAWLTLITAHELAHQWWYSSVGDDQAQTPYLDEAFATYSELLFLEKAHPDLVKWWWALRIKDYQPKGYVDASVYEFPTERLYINAIYLRGVMMLQEIRGAIGDEAFLRWLYDYASTQADQIATSAALWKLLSPADYAKTVAIRADYLRNPDLLPAAPTPATTQPINQDNQDAPENPLHHPPRGTS